MRSQRRLVNPNMSIGGYSIEYQSVLDKAISLGFTIPNQVERDRQQSKINALVDNNLWDKLEFFMEFKGEPNAIDFRTLCWKRLVLTDKIPTENNFTWDNEGGTNDQGSAIDLNWNIEIANQAAPGNLSIGVFAKDGIKAYAYGGREDVSSKQILLWAEPYLDRYRLRFLERNDVYIPLNGTEKTYIASALNGKVSNYNGGVKMHEKSVTTFETTSQNLYCFALNNSGTIARGAIEHLGNIFGSVGLTDSEAQIMDQILKM